MHFKVFNRLIYFSKSLQYNRYSLRTIPISRISINFLALSSYVMNRIGTHITITIVLKSKNQNYVEILTILVVLYILLCTLFYILCSQIWSYHQKYAFKALKIATFNQSLSYSPNLHLKCKMNQIMDILSQICK